MSNPPSDQRLDFTAATDAARPLCDCRWYKCPEHPRKAACTAVATVVLRDPVREQDRLHCRGCASDVWRKGEKSWPFLRTLDEAAA